MWLPRFDSIFSQFTEKLSELETQQPSVFDRDLVRDKLDSLLNGKVGNAPTSQEELEAIYASAKLRFSQKRPPGYMDRKKEGRPEYLYGGLLFRREFGDYVLWHQLIAHAVNQQWKRIIFVTDDDKEDWWWAVESKGKKTIGPRPELVEEMMRLGRVEAFYIYNSERLLELSKSYLGTDVEPESIDQIRSTKEANKDPSTRAPASLVLFEEWLRRSNPDAEITRRHSYPQLLLAVSDSSIRCYGVSFVRFGATWRESVAGILGKRNATSGDLVNVLVTPTYSQTQKVSKLIGELRPQENIIVGYKKLLATGKWSFQPFVIPRDAER